MARERIYIYDTTWRDGQQTPGIDFSVEDKKQVELFYRLGWIAEPADIFTPACAILPRRWRRCLSFAG